MEDIKKLASAAARDLYDWCNMMSEGLFEDAEIVERVKNHPMALWKCKEWGITQRRVAILCKEG